MIPAQPPAPPAASLGPPNCQYAAAPRSSAPTRVWKLCCRCLPASSPAAQIAPCHASAAVFASNKTKTLRFRSRGRMAGPFGRPPPARRSVCSNTSVWFLTPSQYADPQSLAEGRFTRHLHHSRAFCCGRHCGSFSDMLVRSLYSTDLIVENGHGSDVTDPRFLALHVCRLDRAQRRGSVCYCHR